MTKQPDPLHSDPTNGAWDDEPPRKTLLRMFDEAAQWPAIRAAIRAVLHVTDTPAPDLRSKRLQSAHHRLLQVTAVTCPACKAERARTEADQ